MTSEPYDFRKPGRLPVSIAQRFDKWFKRTCAITSANIAKEISTPMTFKYQGVTTSRPPECIATLDSSTIAYVLLFEQLTTLLILPRQLTLAVTASLLGEGLEHIPEDRELTPVEETLLEMFVTNLSRAIVEGWPDNSDIGVKLGKRELSPERTKIFKPDETVVLCRLDVQGSFGRQQILWILPEEPVIAMSLTEHKEPEAGPVTEANLESLAVQLPVEMSVTLGHAELRLSDLANLSEGDLILLDQKVNDPLTAEAEGGLRFMVWPGRVGGRRACQIASTDV